MDKNKILFAVNLVLALFFIFNAIRRPIYLYDGALYFVLVIGLWRYGRALNQTFGSIALIFTDAFLHNLGVFDAYSITGYDKFMHFFFGLVVSYAILLFARKRTDHKTAIFFAIIGTLGIGAIGEISEFIGYQFEFGSPLFEGGLLDPGSYADVAAEKLNYTDTMTDFISGLLGAIATTLFASVRFLKPKSKR